jgi:hypothetical protein
VTRKHDPKRAARPLTGAKPGLRKASGSNGADAMTPAGRWARVKWRFFRLRCARRSLGEEDAM